MLVLSQVFTKSWKIYFYIRSDILVRRRRRFSVIVRKFLHNLSLFWRIMRQKMNSDSERTSKHQVKAWNMELSIQWWLDFQFLTIKTMNLEKLKMEFWVVPRAVCSVLFVPANQQTLNFRNIFIKIIILSSLYWKYMTTLEVTYLKWYIINKPKCQHRSVFGKRGHGCPRIINNGRLSIVFLKFLSNDLSGQVVWMIFYSDTYTV